MSELVNKYEDLVKKFAPIFYLHSKEKYFPLGLETYLLNSEVWHKDELVYNKGECNWDKINNKIVNGKKYDPIHFKLNIDEKKIYGDKTNLAPHYVAVIEDNELIQITYAQIYPNNPGYTMFNFGQHKADLEHVLIQIHKKNMNEIFRMYYSSHSSGQWKLGDEIIKENNRPVVYIAKGSHACYSKSGTWVRIGGFANDICNKGIKWDPLDNNLVILKDQGYVYYPGVLGLDGYSCFYNRYFTKKIRKFDPESSEVYLKKRLFRCFY